MEGFLICSVNYSAICSQRVSTAAPLIYTRKVSIIYITARIKETKTHSLLKGFVIKVSIYLGFYLFYF